MISTFIFLAHHKLSAYCLHISAPQEYQHLFTSPVSYVGPSAGYKFITDLLKFRKIIRQIYEEEFQKPINPLTDEQQNNYDLATHCVICGEEFTCSDLTVEEYQSNLKSQAFSDNIENEDMLHCLSTDLLGPKCKDHFHTTGEYRYNIIFLFFII